MAKNKYLDDDFKEELVKIIQSSNINFLIGAGFSGDLLKTLGNLEKTMEIIQKNLNDSRYIALASFMYWKFFEESMHPICDKVNKKSLKQQMNFLKIWLDILNERQSSILTKQINIFTTNYDIILEFSMENEFIDYNDGFSGRINPYFITSNYNKLLYKQTLFTSRKSEIPIFNIFKIHGSLTWGTDCDDKNKIIYQNYKRILEDFYTNNLELFSEKLEEYNITSIINVYEKIEKCNWENLNSDFIKSIITEIECTDGETQKKFMSFIKRYKETFKIVNPTKAKFCDTIVNKNYYELIRIYCNEIEKENSVLFVLGFSFNDEHIEDITKRSLNNPSLIIIIFAYSKENMDSFNKKFEQYNNVMVVGLSEWGKKITDDSTGVESAEAKDEAAATNSEEKPTELKLDLLTLNEFLTKIRR
ncbi:SIR2 family protein [Clostridium tyrobutyricum]|uniref:SIR2 family protein n=1 Tax=Clostridium tyrobutyricum TaxID=1519 RepID=UPI001C3935BE|nr:SIR2 family protein [Clostridium tyrobutyricum]